MHCVVIKLCFWQRRASIEDNCPVGKGSRIYIFRLGVGFRDKQQSDGEKKKMKLRDLCFLCGSESLCMSAVTWKED